MKFQTTITYDNFKQGFPRTRKDSNSVTDNQVGTVQFFGNKTMCDENRYHNSGIESR